MVMRKTVMESSAEMPGVTFSPDSLGTWNTKRAAENRGKVHVGQE